MKCREPTRRSLVLTALVAGAALGTSRAAADDEDQPGSDGAEIKASDLKAGGPPVNAWPKDPKTSVIRKGSRLNEILLIKLDSGELDEETRSRCASPAGKNIGIENNVPQGGVVWVFALKK